MNDLRRHQLSQRLPARLVTVLPDRLGQRIDNFLLLELKSLPRPLVYKLIRSGQVRVNGRRIPVAYKLQSGDAVRIPPLSIESRPASDQAISAAWLAGLKAAIVYEDDNLLVVDKPSGMACHGGSGITCGVIEGLRALRPSESIELAHRLDRDTSGLLLIVKKRRVLTELHSLLRDHSTSSQLNKTYLTLLVGRMPAGVMQVDAPLATIVRSGGERHARVDPNGKPSLSCFRLLERRAECSLCEVTILTGRTHQIRVHAQHIGFPVAGDDKYGDGPANQFLRQKAGLRRLFLHAARLEFALEQGQRPYLLHAPLPAELATAYDRLLGLTRRATVALANQRR